MLTRTAVLWAHSLSANTSMQDLHKPMHGHRSHIHTGPPMALTQTCEYMHRTRWQYKCVHKSNTNTITGVSRQRHTSPITEGIPAAQTTAPQPSILANKAQACPIGSTSPWLEPAPALPAAACLGAAPPAPAPAASSAQGSLPGAAGRCSSTSRAPPSPPRPATSASGPQPGLHLTHLCRQWAG